jgi:hypothetical protein
MTVTRLELEEIVRRVWPATYLVRATLTQDVWEVELKSRGIVTYHRVDSNGHPACHDTCADREANLEENELRETPYARELRTTRRGDNRIERLLIKSSGQEAVRLSWWPEGRMANRPMDLPEDEFIALLAQGVTQGVLSSLFVFRLIEAIKATGQSARGAA